MLERVMLKTFFNFVTKFVIFEKTCSQTASNKGKKIFIF
jgi:hypothetical protein